VWPTALCLLGAIGLTGCTPHAAVGARARTDREAWVATRALQSDPGDTVVAVDLRHARLDPPVTTASLPTGLALADGGRRLLVANAGDDTLSIVDTATGRVLHRVGVGLEPDAVAVAPGGSGGRGVALVADFGSDTVTPVDLGRLSAGAPIPVGSGPVAIAVAPAGGAAPGAPGTGAPVAASAPMALVADFSSGEVTPIALPTLRAGPAVPVGSEPYAIGIAAPTPGSPVTALVADFGATSVTPVHLGSMQAAAPIPLAGNPTDIAVRPGAVTAWVTEGAALTPVSTVTLAPGAPIPLPYVAEAVALEGPGRAWVALQDGVVVAVALPSGRVGVSVRVGGRPTAIVTSG
jgi:YVTN family beta-propeller protein